ncbi:MAG: phosphoribosylformylglycinamidine synthase I [Deltaproteobacteria bacterium RIFCSPHIGHO2_02_FULL_40_11]|nr:MAG: phosphoribosylformylglycinamidine synthase I [Deltaproteobacteria bacterium RIFCSPHIGHO2_02_FULL_40_11]
MKWGVVTFPGSNCDHDCIYVLKELFHQDVQSLWYKETNLKGLDAVILPGGFSYGDYLRVGAMAAQAPMMKEVISFSKKGGLVLGICNGFQILTESGLLPGALLRNTSLKFMCDTVELSVSNANAKFTNRYTKNQKISMPIAHADGNYFIDSEGLKKLQDQDQILFRYTQNPNGSVDDIAGICNEAGNVLGLMPHPERVCEDVLGGEDGRALFESMMS